MSENLAALLFLAVGAACGVPYGIISPIAEKKRIALFFSDLFLAVISGAVYILTAHALYSGRIEFWSAGVFAAALFASYIAVRCLTVAVLYVIDKLKEQKATEKPRLQTADEK